MISLVFQIDGMMAVLMVVLKSLARKSIPLLPRCLSMMGEIPSGPTALEFLETLMASLTWAAVKLYTLSALFCLIFLMVHLKGLVGFLEAGGVYCRLRRAIAEAAAG